MKLYVGLKMMRTLVACKVCAVRDQKYFLRAAAGWSNSSGGTAELAEWVDRAASERVGMQLCIYKYKKSTASLHKPLSDCYVMLFVRRGIQRGL